VLLLAAAEGLLALAGVGSDRGDPLAGFAPGQRVFEIQEQGGEEWLVTRPSRLVWFNEQHFPRHKSEGTLRVFTLGGSTTFGRPYDDAVSFSSWLRLLLDEAQPGRPHEVINAGGISYASYRIGLLVEELLAYEPDAFVIYTGHNEFLEERTWPELRSRPGILRQIQSRLSRLRTASLLRRVLGGEGEAPDPLAERGLDDDVRARLDVQDGLEAYERDDALRERVLSEFRDNLRQIVTRARDAGVAVVLVEPASNLKDFSPFKAEPSTEVGSEARRLFDDLLAQGREALAAPQPGEAAEVLRRAVDLDPRHAEARFLLGRAELSLERVEAARLELEAAREEDVCPLRALAPIVAAVSEVGRDLDVPVIRLPELLEEDSRSRGGHGLLGAEQFLDHVHPTVEVHQRLAEEILAVLGQGGLTARGAIAGERRDQVFSRYLAALDPAYFARRDVNLGKVLGWAGKTEESWRALERAVEALPDDAEAHFYLAIQLDRGGRVGEAISHYRRAAELEPRNHRARFNLGRALQDTGDPEGALAALLEARELEPSDGPTLYELARTHGALGDLAAAREMLAEAREADPTLEGLDALQQAIARQAEATEAPLAAARRRAQERPGDPAAHNTLGEALGRSGEVAAAEGAFRHAIDLDPSFVPAWGNLAAALQMRGELAEAEAALTEVTSLVPREAQAWLDLGILRRARGDVVGATEAFERAVELQPTLARAWSNLGAARAARGDSAGALEAFEETIGLAPDDPNAHFNLSVVLREAGREAEAARHAARARELEADRTPR
jgi:Flp pilus assembly protein TadD